MKKLKNPVFLIFILLFSCKKESKEINTLFQLLSPEETGISFRNDLTYTEQVNPYTFRNFYNGAGVALGDINNDGLLDIFFAGNQTSNTLYLNEGNFKFRDITKQAGLSSEGSWSTGVSMADINNDGLIDIFVCKSGPLGGEKRHNELFINQGNSTFLEQSEAYGLADIGLSQHAVFFDFDKDGDLDLYLLSNSGRSVGIYDLRTGQREQRDPEGGNKLYRNDGDHFTDVSEAAGIFGSAIGYGLGVTVADLNDDSWPDLYVSNDFFERDYLYVNNQDGTFSEVLPELLPEISMGSMGADIADLDNDSRPDIFVTEMLPASMERVKTKTPFEDWDKAQASKKAGYHHQFTRNTLQRNLGFQPTTGMPVFAEVARQSGVHATDWSWGALIFDADNDGLKDIFVANGIVKDLTDFDYVDFYVNNQENINAFKKDSVLLTKMIDEFPSNPQQNYWFKNYGDWKFINESGTQGLNQLTFSTGAVYGDLDNDGDLDLIVNNLNDRAFVYQNLATDNNLGNYLKVDLGNAFGAKVTCFSNGNRYFQEFQPVKGYLSSVDQTLLFGLGKVETLDSIHINWPDKSLTRLINVPTNQKIKPKKDNSSIIWLTQVVQSSPFHQINLNLPFTAPQNDFVDFDRDRLRFWMISDEGPKVAKADVNGDGLEDLFIPGAMGYSSSLWIQSKEGKFLSSNKALFEKDRRAEDVAGYFQDLNGDTFPDLIVASGSIEFPMNDLSYQDRIYLNDGKGNFTPIASPFPSTPTGFILSHDLDRDGDLDLVLGERAIPFAYGVPAGLTLWENDGKGNFSLFSNQLGAKLNSIGMLTSGSFADLDGDGSIELIVVGEWTPIMIYSLQNGQLINRTDDFGFSQSSGLWNTLLVDDLNGDGKPDIFAGNRGLNSRLFTSPQSELRMLVNDFDQNGAIEQILINQEATGGIPWVMKTSLLKQIPSLRKQLLTYASYQNKTLEALFPESVLSKSVTLKAQTLASKLWINDGNGNFKVQVLPAEIQQAPIYAIKKINTASGKVKLLLGGNQSRIKPELGSQMGSYGWVLNLEPDGSWKILLPEQSGLYIPGEIRDFETILINNQPYLLVIRTNENPIAFEIR
jgi:enediyne biosynthesis protein E4